MTHLPCSAESIDLLLTQREAALRQIADLAPDERMIPLDRAFATVREMASIARNELSALRPIAPAQAESEETPTKEDFAKWSRAWHNTCDTILTLLGLPGNGSPQEMLAKVQDYVGRAPPQASQLPPGELVVTPIYAAQPQTVEVTDAMISAGLDGWFSVKPTAAESDAVLERSMRAALKAALAVSRLTPEPQTVGETEQDLREQNLRGLLREASGYVEAAGTDHSAALLRDINDTLSLPRPECK